LPGPFAELSGIKYRQRISIEIIFSFLTVIGIYFQPVYPKNIHRYIPVL